MNRTILITGASDGIGKAIALELSKSKYDLILLARDSDRLNSVKEEALSNGSSNVISYTIDLRDIESIKRVVKDIDDNKYQIDGLINNAGIWQKVADLDDIPEQEIFDVINTNLTGLILLTQKLLPIIKRSSNGFIINISSRSGLMAQKGQSVYSASKYGVRGFTEVLREDLKDSEIRVAGIYQGGTNTNMFNKAGDIWGEDKLSTFVPKEELAKVISFLIERPKGIWLPEIRIEKN